MVLLYELSCMINLLAAFLPVTANLLLIDYGGAGSAKRRQMEPRLPDGTISPRDGCGNGMCHGHGLRNRLGCPRVH